MELVFDESLLVYVPRAQLVATLQPYPSPAMDDASQFGSPSDHHDDYSPNANDTRSPVFRSDNAEHYLGFPPEDAQSLVLVHIKL